MMLKRVWQGGLSAGCALLAGTNLNPVRAAESGEAVVVIYNAALPESKQVAEHYAQRRQVPAGQVAGFDLPTSEGMTRGEFIEKLQRPLLKFLEDRKLFSLLPATNTTLGGAVTNARLRRVAEARIRYAVLCYGVPTKVLRDPNLLEPGSEQLREELRRNEASVDSDLACLPVAERDFKWTGPVDNPFFSATNAAVLHPTNGVLMVTRLDGPGAAIARGLVDKALEAETNGLWGRAYFDSRGITNGNLKLGDDWIRQSAVVATRLGFETVLDENPATFPASFPLSHVALYAGWYDGHVSGPFARPQVEFMPGAFAYHLHSFSAAVLRSTNQHWVGPLLAQGATLTMGSVDEPYLVGTPDVGRFLAMLIMGGFSFGEAACAAQGWLSWQNIAVGDPLYRPFARRPDVVHAELQARGSKLLEWSHLRVVNLNLATGLEPDQLLNYLAREPLTRKSAVLREKQADLYWAAKSFADALDTYEAALKQGPSPQQTVRLLLTLAEKRTMYGPDQAAFDWYQRLLKEFPDYPDRLGIYQKLLPLAQKLEKPDEVARIEGEVRRLAPPPLTTTNAPPAK
jgi:uncharacterized protein (TIGR03790 family)